MLDIDIPVKRIMQIRPEDYVEFIVPGCEKEWITEFNPEKVPKRESIMDKLLLITTPEEEFILNIEPHAYYDKTMPARMLRYRADIWEYTLHRNMGTPSIKQVVIYFFKKDDNKIYSLNDNWGEESTLKFSYKAIKIWENKKDAVLQKKLLGLYPLLPLMKKELNETNEDVMKKTVGAIQMVEDEALKADLFAVTSILGAYAFTAELVKKYIGRDMLMNSPLFNEWVEEERKEAAKESARKYILELLTEKFDFVSKDIRNSIVAIDDIEVLDELLKKIIRIDTIEDFQKLLDKAKKMI